MANGLIQRYRTLGELRTELKARLGFVAQGPASNNNNPVLNSFLQEGHDYVFGELTPSPMKKRTEISLEAGSTLYDWHNDLDDEDIDPGFVESVWLKRSETERYQLRQGITESDRAFTTRSDPTKYDTLNGQMEVWPTPVRADNLVIEYLAPKPRFTQDADRPGVPDRLVLLYAIANGKSHYRHPDAQIAGATFTTMLNREKSKQHENRRYIVNGNDPVEETVTGQDGVYTMRVR